MFGAPQVCHCRGGVRLAVPRKASSAYRGHRSTAADYCDRLHRIRAFSSSNLDVSSDGDIFREKITPEEEETLRAEMRVGGLGPELFGLDQEEMDAKGVTVKDVSLGDENLNLPDEEVEEVRPNRSKSTEEENAAFPFKVGDNVRCIVLWSSDRGCKLVIGNTRYQGWCLARDFPYKLAENMEPAGKLRPFDGFVREFKVMAVPVGCRPGEKGPLMSARAIDRPLIFRRIRQLVDACTKDFEAIDVKFMEANEGGIRAMTCGASAFLPRSQCVKDSSRYYTNEIRDWGAFICIDDTNISCLLHISNISQAKVPSVNDIFEVGDRVCAVIISMEDNFQRVSVSTADLEENPGDMMLDKEKVYEHGPIAVAQIQKEIDAQRAEYSEE